MDFTRRSDVGGAGDALALQTRSGDFQSRLKCAVLKAAVAFRSTIAYVFSANGASSFLAWGNAPGFLTEWGTSPAGAGRLKPCYGLAHPPMSRAFSAYEFFDDSNLGRCPRLQMNRAFGAKHVRDCNRRSLRENGRRSAASLPEKVESRYTREWFRRQGRSS